MNFLSQLGILAVILIILIILIKSNQTLEKIYMEEEKKEENPISSEPEIPKLEIPKLKAPKIEMPKWPFGKKTAGKGRESETEVKEKRSVKPQIEETEKNVESVSRSQATMPMETGHILLIEVLDERGRAAETKKVFNFPYTIGRNEENDLVLDDLSVSSFHARLEEEEGKIVLYDQGSLNKLMVNGRQEIQVPIGAEVEVGLGNTSLRFLKEVKRSNPTLYYAGTSLMEEWH